MPHVIYVDLPHKVHGCSAFDENGYQTIILNARDSKERQIKTYIHECKHSNDFGFCMDVNNIEYWRHK